jgi:2-polyprenyl-3-methyl-5-hydroxy-6-metoxy-1,4-benzoquinol methylase
MTDTHRKYIPALRFGWLTPLYDPLVRWTMREAIFKPRLVEQAHIQPGHRLLDLGCGTATLTLLIKQAHPEAEVVGLDGDSKVLALASTKIATAGVHINLDKGLAFDLPYQDHSFDRVFSSLLLHHLTLEQKRQTLKEVFRVLQPGGELHVADFGKPHHAVMVTVSLIVRWFEEAADNMKGLLPELLREAGFDGVEETARYSTAFGTLSLLKAVKPRGRMKSEENHQRKSPSRSARSPSSQT